MVFSDELNSIFEYCKRIIYESDSPYWQMKLLTELASIDRENSKKEFSSFLEKKIKIFCNKGEYISARFLIDSLKIISSINTNEWHIRRAMNFELEGDSLVKTKEPNYYYPKISKIYLEGLREINKTEGCKDLKHRLEHKVGAEQIENYKMIQVCGGNIAPDINHEKIKKIIIGAGIKDFQTGYSNILLIPIIPICDIERYKDGIQDNDFSRQYFSDHVKINNKGCTIGKSQIDEYELFKIRNNCRERIISFLKPIKLVMDIDRKIKRDFVFYLIDQCNSKFIPKEREYIFAEGLYAGFQNDFILSSHLLIPQIENSLKFIAQQNNTTISKLTEEIQQDNTLGGILEKIKIITKADLYAELYGFLVDANDTNFRNELCHGLMNPVLLEHYGIYLWWLSLKMIIQTEDYFSFTE